MEKVAPFVGAWIEIDNEKNRKLSNLVAPFVGAWIEIYNGYGKILSYRVAPFVGAWIEIAVTTAVGNLSTGRSVRRSVD